MITSWEDFFHQVSWGLDKKCGFFTNGQFLSVSGFFTQTLLTILGPPVYEVPVYDVFVLSVITTHHRAAHCSSVRYDKNFCSFIFSAFLGYFYPLEFHKCFYFMPWLLGNIFSTSLIGDKKIYFVASMSHSVFFIKSKGYF